MNRLENIELNNSMINGSTLQGSSISTSNLDLRGSVVSIDEYTSVNIGSDYYTGKDIKELIDLKNKIKEMYPELFV